MTPPPVCFWLNIYSPHLAEFINALGERRRVTVIVDRLMTGERRGDGWAVPTHPKCEVRVVRPDSVPLLLDTMPSDTLHIFAPRGSALSSALVREIPRRGLRFGLIAEKPLGGRIALFAKRILYRVLSLRLCRAEFFMAMGPLARIWYDSLGFRNVREFGYTVPHSIVKLEDVESGPYRFICIARMIERKNHFLLLRAFSQIGGDWTLDLVGSGPCIDKLRRLARRFGIADKIKWRGAIANHQARELISHADTLVLPSKSEGWGAVCNEAVAEGTRLIVSSSAGARCLCQLKGVGHVFDASSCESLRAALRRDLALGKVAQAERISRREIHRRIDGPAIARYFESIVDGSTASPPWLSHDTD